MTCHLPNCSIVANDTAGTILVICVYVKRLGYYIGLEFAMCIKEEFSLRTTQRT